MLRIFLILSLAVALAGVGFSFVLKGKVEALSTQRDEFEDQRNQAQAAEARARDAERTAVAAEKAAKAELETTSQELAATTARFNEAESRLTRVSQDLEKTMVDRDTAQRELARWEVLGVRPEDIARLKGEAARMKDERDTFGEENKVLGREVARLNEELDIYRGRITEVQMPDTQGRIVAVDSNYQFVTLDVGSESGLKQNGKMIVTRGDQLVAKVQLVRVEPQRSVANLLPEWARGDVQAGDLVITSYEALKK